MLAQTHEPTDTCFEESPRPSMPQWMQHRTNTKANENRIRDDNKQYFTKRPQRHNEF